MGVDIDLITTNQDDLYQEEYNYFYEHSLSRPFCNLMQLRQGTREEEPLLDRIGRLAQVDITPLYAMETYPEEHAIEWQLQSAFSEAERQAIIQQAETDKAALEGNLETVRATIEALIHRLSVLPDLAALLSSRWGGQAYFSDFTHDTGDGYIGNNFGQDLRNFKRFLDYAKEHGSTTVYFLYG